MIGIYPQGVIDTVSIFKLAWERFRLNAKGLGDIQGHIAAGVFYFTVMIPFGLITRFNADPLRIKPTTPAGWVNRDPVLHDMESAKRQG